VQPEQHGLIVVGVDGSDPSQRALRWALREAALRGDRVQVVTAWHLPLLGTGEFPWAVVPPASYLEMESDDLARRARERLEQTVREAASQAAADEAVEVPTELRVVESGAAAALLDASRGADLLVVGSRGRGGFAGLLLGSVSQQCSQHATCPVVVVR
jgi:nucleotide-binding universal stress UspA family protein